MKTPVAVFAQRKEVKWALMVHDGYKYPFDLALLMLSHFLFFPLWIFLWSLIILAIWLEDQGPIFYVQERLGKDHKRFKIIKFRTMVRNAEALTGPVWASQRDPRVTKVGKLLRRFHLDEMPQAINVVRGEMSLVGPRPERPVLAEKFGHEVPNFSQRLLVKPGITGLAQIRGHYSTSPGDKLRYDNLYIRNMSRWLDFKLLCISVVIVMKLAWSGPKSDNKGEPRSVIQAWSQTRIQ